MPEPNNPASLADLEGLPYLTAVAKEGLRLGHSVAHRSCRQFRDKALNYHGVVIPAGSAVCMTTMHVLMNETIFPESWSFRSERWLDAGNGRLDRYHVGFSRGHRACLGINLARAELYLTLAAIYRRFDFDVTRIVKERDIEVSRDFILAAPSEDSGALLVKVKAAI